MNELQHFWQTISATPLMGMTLTLLCYMSFNAFYIWRGHAAWATPMFWSTVVIIIVLLVTKTSYETYFQSAQFIHFLLGPSVVAMGVLLWRQWAQLRKQMFPLIVASVVGGGAAVLSAVLMGWMFGLPKDILISLTPKSMTSPVAAEIASKINAIVSLTAVFTAITGVTGALIGRFLFKIAKIKSHEAQGYALGTASHGIGTSCALQISPVAGSYAALAMVIQAVLGALAIPLIFMLF